MGVWGPNPWDSDESADWFGDFFDRCDISLVEDEINNFDETSERYESLRAACFLLQKLGRIYIWPILLPNGDRRDVKGLIAKAITLLENMIHPPNERWTYLELGVDAATVASIEAQIAELRERHSEWAS